MRRHNSIGSFGLLPPELQTVGSGSQLFTASGSFQVPTGRTEILVTGVGSGQAGTPAAFPSSGAGGKGGRSIDPVLPVTPGEVLDVVIGTHAELWRGSTCIARAVGGAGGADVVPLGNGYPGGNAAATGGGAGAGYSFAGADATDATGAPGGSQSAWGIPGNGGAGGDAATPGHNYGGGGGGGGLSLQPGGAAVLLIEWVS